MYVKCDRCGTYAMMRDEQSSIRCVYCHGTFTPSRAHQRTYRRQVEAARSQQRMAPLGIGGSLAVFAVTVFLLLAQLRVPSPADLFTTPASWVFPGWIGVLVAIAYAIWNTDRYGSLR